MLPPISGLFVAEVDGRNPPMPPEARGGVNEIKGLARSRVHVDKSRHGTLRFLHAGPHISWPIAKLGYRHEPAPSAVAAPDSRVRGGDGRHRVGTGAGSLAAGNRR